MLCGLKQGHLARISLGPIATVGPHICLEDLEEAVMDGAVKRLRPKVMTVACMLFGLLPIMWSVGAGGDVMKRIAAPMIGGIFTSFIMELVVYPAIYAIWKWRWEVKPALEQAS